MSIPAHDVLCATCPSRSALDLLAERWSLLTVHALLGGRLRHGELLGRIEGLSGRMLTQTLRGLEAHGLVERRAYAEVPPRVEYELTPLGRSLAGPVRSLVAWAEAHADDVAAAKAASDRAG